MVQALRYIDEESDQFWRVEISGCALVINWGKTGTAGYYEIKEFDTEEKCEKQALNLAASKQKNGYTEMLDFDATQHFYFDADEYGAHPLTSHPTFRTYFSDKLYYDCTDEEAPFGSDEGSDTFYELQEVFREQPNVNLADFPRDLIEKKWDLTYLPPKSEQTDDELKKQATQTYNTLPGDQEFLQTDQVILATAFGQIKITGKLDITLQRLALQSLDRMEQMYRLLWNWKEAGSPYHITILRRDLNEFVKSEL